MNAFSFFRRAAAGALTCLTLGAVVTPRTAQATLLAYDGFDYTPGTPLGGQNGGTGWGGAWTVINASGGSLNVESGSLVAGAGSSPAGYDAISSGQSVHLISNYRTGRNLDTSITGPFGAKGYRDAAGRIGADGKVLYISFLQKSAGTSLFYEFEFHRSDLGDGGRIGGIGNDAAGSNVNLRAPNNVQTPIGPGDTNVNFYVVRIDYQAGNDDIRVYRNPTSATEPGSPSLTMLAQADMSLTGISFGAFLNSQEVMHDEVRLGETWADVTSPPPVAPSFTGHPRGTTVFTGSSLSISASASGTPVPTLQWYRDTTPLPGQTTATLTLTNVQPGDAGDYTVRATNTVSTVTSNPAHLTVIARPEGLLGYEGFDYDAGSSALSGKGGGLGWTGPWQLINNGSDDIIAGNLTAGLNAPDGFDALSFGNCVNLPNGRRDGRLLDTTATGTFGSRGYLDAFGNIGADGKTLYISFLQQPNDTTLFYEFEFHRADLGDGGRIGGIGNDQVGTNVNLRAPNNIHLPIGEGNTGVNFYVVRIDYKDGNDDIRVYRNSTSVTEPAVPTLLAPAQADMSFNGISFGAFVNGRTVAHDEVRLGETWQSVVPVGTPVPFTVTNVKRNPNGTVTLTWNSVPGATYTVHYKFDLNGAVSTWPDDADDVASQGQTTTYTTTISFTANPRVFFSIRRNP
ncbi:MAG TPA: immunoglobulin domain-containing protein [Verrucomicrobiales bacterium]|nr:immunoglobulin domain-containing protein [Verrucomicrobiales bacterium]